MKINDEGTSNAAHWHERAMKAEARLADAEREARVLVVAMADQFGAPDNWKPLPDAAGMITQISNMVAGLREERALIVQRAENAEAALVEAEQEYEDARIVREQLEARLAEAQERLNVRADKIMAAEAKLAEADERHSRYVKAVGELAGMAAQRDRAVGHLRDVLAADDGQAWKEARRFLDGIDPPSEEAMKRDDPFYVKVGI